MNVTEGVQYSSFVGNKWCTVIQGELLLHAIYRYMYTLFYINSSNNGVDPATKQRSKETKGMTFEVAAQRTTTPISNAMLFDA